MPPDDALHKDQHVVDRRDILDRLADARGPAQVVVRFHQLPPSRLVARGEGLHQEIAQARLRRERHQGLRLAHRTPMPAGHPARAWQHHPPAGRQPTQQRLTGPPIQRAIGAPPVPRAAQHGRHGLTRPIRMGRHHLLNLGQVGLRDDTPATAEQRRRVWGIRRRRRLGHHQQRSNRAANTPGGSASRSAAWCFHDVALVLPLALRIDTWAGGVQNGPTVRVRRSPARFPQSRSMLLSRPLFRLAA